MLNPQLPTKLFSKDKKLNDAIVKQHYRVQATHERNKLEQLLHDFKPGYLEPEYEGDQTVKVREEEINQAVNVQTAASSFELELAMGSYRCCYGRNGRTLMLTSSQGHCALLDWREKELLLEVNLKEQLGESAFLHNDEMFAISQPSQTFIYDNRGIELHKLPASQHLQYLPYHFLLALSDNRKLTYYDTTTGHIVADHIAKNNYTAMAQNKSNAIIALGTSKGVVEWWTPGIGTPGISLVVGSKVDSIAFHKGYMYTLADSLKVWDVRMLKLLVEQPLQRRAKSMETSGSGLLGVNYGFKV
jgi:U3 small nucleolar RNA-associated protein 7